MTIKYLDSKRISLDTSATFSDDFSSSPNGWTLNHSGSGQSISGGALISSVSPSNGYKAFAIGNPTNFVIDLDWELTTRDTPVVILSSDTSGYGDPSSGNRRLHLIGSANNDGNLRFSSRYYATGTSKLEDNGTLVAGGTSASTGVKYFYRFSKIGTSMSFKRYLTASDRESDTNMQQRSNATDNAPNSGLSDYAYIEVSAHGSLGTNKLYDFKLYSGVTSAPTKPTNVQDNSILVEKNTGNRYWRTPYSSGTGKIDDLTTDKGWTTSNGISGNGYNASDYVDFKLICPDSSSLAGGRVLVDLQHADYLNGSNLSNTAFTARIKINYSALDQASGNQNKSYIGFYSNDSWGGSTQDAFVLQLKLDYGQSSKKFYVEIMNDEVFEGSSHQTEFTSTTPATNTDYYIEFTKDGNDHTIRITTNSDYTGGETQSITYGGVENLRYFGCKARGDTQANGGNAQGTIKPDIGIWNGVTSVDSSPATWTMNPTFEYDMTTDPRTNTFNSSICTITHANSTLQMNQLTATGTSGSATYIDLGSNLSTKWVMRFRTKQSSYSSYQYNSQFQVGMSSVAPTSTAYNISSSLNWIGFRWYFGTQFSAPYVGIEPRIQQNAADNTHSNTNARLYGKPNETTNTTTSYYHEFIWNIDTFTYNLYDNANYTGTKLATATMSASTNTNWVTGTPSSISGLRYFVFKQGADSNMGVWVNQLDDVKIYDGVTTIN